MNLFFRLFLLVWDHWRRPRCLDPLMVSEIRLRLFPNDLDTNGHVNNGRYLTLMDLGRFDYLLSVGIMKHSLRRGWVPVLAGVMVRYRRSLQAFQRVTVRTRLVGWDGPWLYLEQTLTGPEGLASVAYLKGVVKGRRGKVPVDDLLKAAGFRKTSPDLPQAFRDFLAAEEAMYRTVKEREEGG